MKGIKYPSEKNERRKFQKHNLAITLNVLHAKREKLNPVYVSKHNSNREKQVILLMIPNEEKLHYLAVKKNISIKRKNF